MRVLLGVTGSVAAVLTPKLVKALKDAGHEVQVVSTERGLYFFKPRDVDVEKIESSGKETRESKDLSVVEMCFFLLFYTLMFAIIMVVIRWILLAGLMLFLFFLVVHYFVCMKFLPEKEDGIWRDKDEWTENGYAKNDPVPHIDFNKWADVFLIAPLTANTLGKIAGLTADNFLTCIVRAWPLYKPLVIAPAMNTNMWLHPGVLEQLDKIKSWFPNFKVINPVKKKLACGDIGDGAMADISTIVAEVNKLK